MAELKRKAELRETCAVTINLLELVGMVVTAWGMLGLGWEGPCLKGIPCSCAATTLPQCRGSVCAAGQGINGWVYS